MKEQIVLPLRHVSLLRRRIRTLLELHERMLAGENNETIHDLRVSTRRMREILDALKLNLPEEWYARLKKRTKSLTTTLGRLRETEVNLKILETMSGKDIVHPAILEILKHSFSRDLFKRRKKVEKKFSRKKLRSCHSFLKLLHGSRSATADDSNLLQMRMDDFLGFVWHVDLDDEQLHVLRIRAKKLRYALEIEQSIRGRRFGWFLRKIKTLQDLLGTLNDLYVFSQFLGAKLNSWNDLTVVSTGFQQILEAVQREKHLLYPKVYPCYAGIVASAPSEISPVSAAAAI
jgi:CHAD domain-containing protein